MTGFHTPRDRVLDRLLGVTPLASTLGLAGLFVTIALGFEEPNRVMFFSSAGLLVTAPLAAVIHAALTNRLTRARRRIWLRALVSPKAVWAMPRYLSVVRGWVSSGRQASDNRTQRWSSWP
jgi:hypothetical protein